MIRYTILFGFISFLSAYAFKDWFKSLCGLIVLMAVLERADMPKTMLGIPGLNPFNILLFFVLAAWVTSKRKEKRVWDMPTHIHCLLWVYFALITVSLLRLFTDLDLINDYNQSIGRPGSSLSKIRSQLIVDEFINCVKWVIPGILVYDGCRDEDRVRFVLNALLVAVMLIALQIISRMGLGAALDAKVLQQKAVRVLDKTPGYHRVDLAGMMAAAFWAFFCSRLMYLHSKSKQLICLGCAGICFLALILTAGRTGYGAWAIIGVIFSFLRWRILLFIGPVLIAIGIAIVPAAKDRLFEGFSSESHESRSEELGTIDDSGRDTYAITSGRAVVWPFAFEEIGEAPFIGQGRKAFLTTGAGTRVFELLGAPWGHPHNAYIQFILDNGFLGVLPVLIFFFIMLRYGYRLFMHENPLYITIGGSALAFLLAHLISAIGAQSFYPKEGVVFMWVCLGLVMRAMKTIHDEDKKKKKRPIIIPTNESPEPNP